MATDQYALGGGYGAGKPTSFVVVTGRLTGDMPPAVSEPISIPAALTFGGFANGRVAYEFDFGTLQTRDALTAGDVKTITTEAQQGGQLTYPVTAPDRIVFSTFSGPARILATDGVSAPYDLVAEPAADLAGPGFTGTHLVWQRGVGTFGSSGWQTVELWASPYSADPANIVPTKLTTLPWHFVSTELRAAHGRVSIMDLDSAAAVHVWTVPAAEHRVFNTPPGWLVAQIPALYSKELLVMLRPEAKENAGYRLYRVSIDSLPIVPLRDTASSSGRAPMAHLADLDTLTVHGELSPTAADIVPTKLATLPWHSIAIQARAGNGWV